MRTITTTTISRARFSLNERSRNQRPKSAEVTETDRRTKRGNGVLGGANPSRLVRRSVARRGKAKTKAAMPTSEIRTATSNSRSLTAHILRARKRGGPLDSPCLGCKGQRRSRKLHRLQATDSGWQPPQHSQPHPTPRLQHQLRRREPLQRNGLLSLCVALPPSRRALPLGPLASVLFPLCNTSDHASSCPGNRRCISSHCSGCRSGRIGLLGQPRRNRSRLRCPLRWDRLAGSF